MTKQEEPQRYLSAEQSRKDDFNDTFTMKAGEFVYDARMRYGGAWAMMSEESYRVHGYGKLGVGFGQKYERQANGKLYKVEG